VTGHPSASIPFAETRIIQSTVANSDYQVSVALPPGYEENPDRRWPVIYVLDGNWHFGLVADMVRFMNIRIGFCNELPDAIVVGIGYPVEGTQLERLHRVMHLRTRDFVLKREESGEQFMRDHFPIAETIPSGNGLPFMEFLHHELIPLMESEYRADLHDRTLLGHSLGANYALYTMFRKPGLFSRAVIASFDPLLDHEERFAAEHTALPVRMHLVFEGQTEQEYDGPRSLIDRLVSRGYQGLELTEEAMVCTHCAMVPYAYQSGLVQVFTAH
jgi:uncharacterized protein